jgi:peptide/nickel transport system permease protein
MNRLIGVVPTVLLLLLFVVVLIRLLPGNAADILLAEQAGSDGVTRAEVEARLGLDDSLPKEYGDYALGLLRGDLGKSVWSQRSVSSILSAKIGVTLELTALSLFVGAVLGIGGGIIAAVWQNTLLDYGLRSVFILFLSVPSFALATLVIVMPVLWWGWSPPLTYTPIGGGLWPHFSQFFTPALILGTGLAAVLMRLTRTMMLEVLRQDFVRTARAKGLNGRGVILGHAMRNALIPVVSVLGLNIATLLSGTVLIESIFGLPGIGQELVSSLNVRDYPMIQGITVVTGLGVILINLVVDVSYRILDPRIKL